MSREEVREQSRFLELVRAAGKDQVRPVLEFGLPLRHMRRKAEGAHLLADDLRVKEWFGFERHLLVERLFPGRQMPSVFIEEVVSRGYPSAFKPGQQPATVPPPAPCPANHPTAPYPSAFEPREAFGVRLRP